MGFPTDRIKFGRGDAFFFFAALVYVYAHLFQLPFTPIYFDGDVMVPVSNAMRMLDGEVIYRDFFHMTTPGTEVFYESLFFLFGLKVWVINLAIVMLAMAQIGLIWYFSGKVLIGIVRFLPGAIFLVIGFRQFGIDGSYRLFSVIFGLAAVAVLFNKRSWRNLIIAGVLCGFSSFFGQQRGVVVIASIAAFVIWENYKNGFDLKSHFKSGMILGSAFGATIVLTQGYFLWQAGVDNYYYSMVDFLRQNYRHDPLNNLSAYFSDVQNFGDYLRLYPSISAFSQWFRGSLSPLFYYALIPLIYFVFLLYRWLRPRMSEIEIYPRLLLIWFAGAFLTVGITAPTAIRLYQVSIPALVLLVWLLQQNRRISRLFPVALVFLGLLGVAYIVQRQVTQKYFLYMPAGYSAFLSEATFNKYAWIEANTAPGDILYEPHHPNFYFPFHLRNPAGLNMVRDSEFTPAFQIDSIINALTVSRPRIIIWPKNWSVPAESRAPDDHVGPLWQFVKDNYEIRYVFKRSDDPMQARYGDNEVWVLKP